MELQARIWYRQRRLEDAKSEALGALEIFEKLGAAEDLGDCRTLLRDIEEAMESRSTSGESDSSGELAPWKALPKALATDSDGYSIPECKTLHLFANDTPYRTS
jgi:hypothetical protein